MSHEIEIQPLPSPEAMEAAMNRGRKLRSYAFRDMIANIASGLAGLVRRPAAAANAATNHTAFGKVA